MTRLRIVDAVFARPAGAVTARSIAAVSVALSVHLLAAWWAARHPRKPEPPHASTPDIELADAPPPPPPPPVEPPPPPPPPPAPEPTVKHRVAARSLASPSPPAQAGRAVTQEPDPSAPVDLTADTLVTGSGSAYAGGATTTTGTSKHAVDPGDLVGSPSRPRAPAAPDHSSAVALADEDWTCPWPAQADTAGIDEQAAVVRVVVRADGSPESAEVIRDPGFGFGPAAVACAMRARYRPAHDRDGHVIRAASPPIRVRFTRP